MRPLLLLPEIVLFVGGLAVLMTGSFLPRRRQWITRLETAVVLVVAAGLGAVALPGPAATAMEGTFSVDITTGVVRVVATLATLAVLALAGDEIAGSPRESETCALLLFATAGALVLGGATDLLVVAVAFLLAGVPLYGLIGIARTAGGAEAAMKTYLLGALFGIFLLLGVTLLYGVTGSTSYAGLDGRLAGAPPAVVAAGVLAVLAGLMFKAGGVPAHYWVPDAAQGAGGAVAAFATTVPKVGALAAVYRLADVLPQTQAWPVVFAALAGAGMTLGNLAAFWQHDPRRLLGWSTVSQVGYLLVPVAVAGRSELALPSLLYYLAAYAVTNLAAFAVTTALPDRRALDSYRDLAGSHPWLAGSLVVALLGLVGTPPTAVFVGKLTTTAAAWDGGLPWLAVLVFVNTVASLFYYLRWIAPMYRRHRGVEAAADGRTDAQVAPGTVQVDDPAARGSRITAVALASLSLAMGVGAGVLWGLVAGR